MPAKKKKKKPVKNNMIDRETQKALTEALSQPLDPTRKRTG